MSKIATRLAKKLDVESQNDIVYGRSNDIFINVHFNKPIHGSEIRTLTERMQTAKFDSVNIDVYVARKDGIDLKSINRLFEMNYWVYKANRASIIDGRLLVFLYKNNTVDIKVSYIRKFLKFFTEHLKQNEYYSTCCCCESTDNLSYVIGNNTVKEICETCRLKQSDM